MVLYPIVLAHKNVSASKEARKKIEHIRKWVREQPVSAATAVTCGSQYLSTASIKALLDTQDTYNTAHAQKQATK
ncbi:hypothetical protein SARC_18117, partial [Sphaeroforma arctica JP610]